MAKVSQNTGLIDILASNAAERSFLDQLADADPNGFGYLARRGFDIMRQFKAENGRSIGLKEFADTDHSRWGVFKRNSAEGRRGQERPPIEKAADSPIYTWLRGIAKNYGPDGKVPVESLSRLAESLLDTMTENTEGLTVGRRGRVSKLAVLAESNPFTNGQTDASKVGEALGAV